MSTWPGRVLWAPHTRSKVFVASNTTASTRQGTSQTSRHMACTWTYPWVEAGTVSSLFYFSLEWWEAKNAPLPAHLVKGVCCLKHHRQREAGHQRDEARGHEPPRGLHLDLHQAHHDDLARIPASKHVAGGVQASLLLCGRQLSRGYTFNHVVPS